MSNSPISKAGLPLNEAWFALAPRPLQERIIGPGPRTNFDVKTDSKWLDVLKSVSDLAALQTDQQIARNDAMRLIRKDLADGRWESRGVRLPVREVFADEAIPRVFWDDANIDSKTFAATGAGVTYRAIRVYRRLRVTKPALKPEAVPSQPLPAPSLPQPQKAKHRTGRPATGEPIRAAIETLMIDNRLFASMGRRRQCDAVRQHRFGPKVDHTDPPKGWSDSAIKQHLSKLVPT